MTVGAQDMSQWTVSSFATLDKGMNDQFQADWPLSHDALAPPRYPRAMGRQVTIRGGVTAPRRGISQPIHSYLEPLRREKAARLSSK